MKFLSILPPYVATMAVVLTDAATTTTGDPQWLQYGLLGMFVVGILYLKVIVPGWVYQAEVARGIALEKTIKEKDDEIARLRNLAEEKMIPLLERTTLLVQRAEIAWSSTPHQPPGSTPGYPPQPPQLPPPTEPR